MRCWRDVRNAGTVFLGETRSVAFGDYMTGANHVLPTGGLARSYSGLSTLDFVRWTTYQRVTPEAAARLAGDVGAFADAEGLAGARARRARVRWASQHRTVSALRIDSPSVRLAAAARRRPPRACARELRGSTSRAYRAPCAIDLSDNTNLWGAPAGGARVHCASAAATRRHALPALVRRGAQAALADYAGVAPDDDRHGCGSDDVLDCGDPRVRASRATASRTRIRRS